MLSESPIWRIKYLPHTLGEICGRNDIKERLKDFNTDRNFPHLLFVGSKGIGKTIIADLFSKEFYSERELHTINVGLKTRSPTLFGICPFQWRDNFVVG